MKKLKSIQLYFFSIIKLSLLSFRNYYFSTNFYNKKLITFIPDRIFYNPSTHLSSSLATISNDFYKITDTSPELLWKLAPSFQSKANVSFKEKINFSGEWALWPPCPLSDRL